jgi:Flp pilus assembly pilin Flp
MTWFRKMFQQLQQDERGATMVEYLIIIAVVGVAAIGIWSAFGGAIQDKLNEQTGQVSDLPG